MFRYRTLVHLISILLNAPAGASPLDPFENSVSPLQVIRDFRHQGMRLVEGGACEKLLLEARADLKRPLTFEDIERNLPAILQATGESLEPSTKVPAPEHVGCFAGTMGVLTPNGEVSIMNLYPGAQVISIDLVKRRKVVNVVAAVHVQFGDNFGVLEELARPITVTAQYPFYASNQGTAPRFHPISGLSNGSRLHFANRRGITGTTRRGCFQALGEDWVGYDLELSVEPRNFILNGILVQNQKQAIF